ncbi:hypothetical protein T36_1747 [Helicobacter cinaedi]|uniref:hypothetical protein n=1 Tax=Helicobacter cinaedi TaxID=213 RepID=UPI001F3E39C6|nr:hypothetical protein [Helicobacter cinaedi]BDB65271.1 hypothetical protein T36_1747 [Helicobacter cinaedi]
MNETKKALLEKLNKGLETSDRVQIAKALCGSLSFDITEAMHQDKKQYFLEVTQGEILGITDDGLMLDYASSFCEPCIALWIESKEEAVEKVWGLINLLKEKKGVQMSYFTDVKAKVKSIAKRSITDNDGIYTWEYIHNVGGLDIYIEIQENNKYYDVVLCEVKYSTLEITEKDEIRTGIGKKFKRFEYRDLDSMAEKVASLICANKFL